MIVLFRVNIGENFAKLQLNMVITTKFVENKTNKNLPWP